MKKGTFLRIICISQFMLFVISFGIAQHCLPNGIVFFEQSEIDNFKNTYPGCTTIGGNVSIRNTRIQNLDGLSVLNEVEGNVLIEKNAKLTSVEGLGNISKVHGKIEILNNDSLENIHSFQKLFDCGGLTIYGNSVLKTIDGFTQLKNVFGNYYIELNPQLKTLSGFDTLIFVSGIFRIQSNQQLLDIASFDHFAKVGKEFIIQNNNSILEILNFNRLDSIGSAVDISKNNSLRHLAGFESLKTCKGLTISHNVLLQHIVGFNRLQESFAHFEINNNQRLINLSGFRSLEKTGPDIFSIASNDSLSQLSGLPRLKSIEGKLTIGYNGKLKSIQAFDSLQSIKDGLQIVNNSHLQTLEGFHALKSLRTFLDISYNGALQNLKGLENLVLLTGGYVSILNNTVLESLEGIQNMNSQSISSIFIQENPLLSHCEIKSVCQFLDIDSANAFIEFNLQGCNNKKEVTEKCLVKTEESNKKIPIHYYPNPFTESITIENQEKEQLLFIKDVMGKVVLQLHVHKGNHSYSLEALDPGIYILGNGVNQASRLLKIK